MLKILENECAKKIVSDALLTTLFYVSTGKLKPQQDTVDSFLHITWNKEIEQSVYIRLNKRVVSTLDMFVLGLDNKTIVEKLSTPEQPAAVTQITMYEDLIAFSNLMKTPKVAWCIRTHYPSLVDIGSKFSLDKLRADIQANKMTFKKFLKHLDSGIIFD